jgi:hypothetical protein
MQILGGMQILDMTAFGDPIPPPPPPTLAGSLLFNGTSSSLSLTPGTDISGAFTIEGWFYNNSSLTNAPLISSDQAEGMSIRIVDDTLIFVESTTEQFLYFWEPGTIKTNTWQYIVLNRNEDLTETMWIGDYGSATAVAPTLCTGGTPVDAWSQTSFKDWDIINIIGNEGSYYFPGYMTNVRFTTNSAKYNSNYSTINIPTRPLTADINTKYLMLGAVSTTDTSGNQTVVASDVTQSSSKPY